jgi:peptidyl-prolyl cis-trans isomerase A (cyclophilin A)
MKQIMQATRANNLVLFTVALCWLNTAFADLNSALQAMEDPQNPLMLINTSQGKIYLELFPEEAPNNIANFIALAEGERKFTSLFSGDSYQIPYYDGMRFHRVVPGFVIQAGSARYSPLGKQLEPLADEINADFLGLDKIPAINADGSFAEILNIANESDFQTEILQPFYDRENIANFSTVLEKQNEILQELQQLSVKSVYENQGYRYDSKLNSRAISRGIVALANSGPNSNGSEFFISLADAPWLTGKHTVIGKVVEGEDVMDDIGTTEIDAAQFSPISTLIFSIRRVN